MPLKSREARCLVSPELREFELQVYKPLTAVLQCHLRDSSLKLALPPDAEAELDLPDGAEVCLSACQLLERQLVLHCHLLLDCTDDLPRPLRTCVLVPQFCPKLFELVQKWPVRSPCCTKKLPRCVDPKRLRHDSRVCDEKEVCLPHQPKNCCCPRWHERPRHPREELHRLTEAPLTLRLPRPKRVDERPCQDTVKEIERTKNTVLVPDRQPVPQLRVLTKKADSGVHTVCPLGSSDGIKVIKGLVPVRKSLLKEYGQAPTEYHRTWEF